METGSSKGSVTGAGTCLNVEKEDTTETADEGSHTEEYNAGDIDPEQDERTSEYRQQGDLKNQQSGSPKNSSDSKASDGRTNTDASVIELVAADGTEQLSPSTGVHQSTISASTVTCASANAQSDKSENVHHIKWIEWSDGKSPIVTQNENGPCPLLAIFNVLLLSKRIILGDGAKFISSCQILARVAEIIWDAMPENLPDDERRNYEQNISDAIGVFPNLQTGLDVNIKFDGVKSFEYTPELAVFDILRIPLYHGWLVDPQDSAANDILCDLSYNQAVEKVINFTSSKNPDDVQRGLIAQEFLESTASQITYHGIVSLRDEMQPGNLAVLFRNNHFCTIHRHNEELFTLITDLGFLKESNVVWESLSGVQGDSQFVNGKFMNYQPKPEATSVRNVPQSTDLDYQLALSMQHDHVEPLSDNQPQYDLADDYMLAQRLQEQENIAAQQGQSSHRPRPSGQPVGQRRRNDRPKDDKCTIL